MAHTTSGYSQKSSAISHKHTRPVAAMAGSFSRKVPGPAFDKGAAGQASQVPVRGGKLPYKAKQGYSVVSEPSYKASPGKLNTKGRGGKQSVKGGHGKAGSDAKQVAGRS